MIRRGFSLLAVVGLGFVFLGIVMGYVERDALSPLAQAYIELVPVELNAPNVVTGILITYRGFDTLGEVAVLFMVAASVGILLAADKGEASGQIANTPRPPSDLVRTGASVILPVILLFGAYVIMNGHISAGGGFQGGAVVASAMMLFVLAFPEAAINQTLLSVTESFAGVFYVTAGILGLVLAGGFLDARFLPPGEFGAVFSAGAIPLISVLLGIKVGAELSVIIARFRG